MRSIPDILNIVILRNDDRPYGFQDVSEISQNLEQKVKALEMCDKKSCVYWQWNIPGSRHGARGYECYNKDEFVTKVMQNQQQQTPVYINIVKTCLFER